VVGMAQTMIDVLLPYKSDVQTITSDNGTEFARHAEISQKLGADFYFAHPYSFVGARLQREDKRFS